jgi:hypothetical protein
MKNILLNPWNLLRIILLIFIILFFILITRNDYTDIPVERPAPARQGFDWSSFKNINQAEIRSSFPYDTYLASSNLWDIKSIRHDLAMMDTVNKDPMMNQEILSIALTEKLSSKMESTFSRYNPDSLISLIQWAGKFEGWSEADEKNSMLFESIHTYWFNFVSNTLAAYYQNDFKVKYNYKFRYACDRLREKHFGTPIRGTYTEKVISHLLQKNWAYLFHKFWYATSPLYKCFIILLFLAILFPYFYIFNKSAKIKQ